MVGGRTPKAIKRRNRELLIDCLWILSERRRKKSVKCAVGTSVAEASIRRVYTKESGGWKPFTSDFQVSPTCAPTRAAMMSGRAPFKNGVTHTISQRERMALDTFTLPQALKTAGYTSGIFGKWHLGDEEDYLPSSRGFDEVLIDGAGGIGQVGLGDFPPNRENCYFDNILLHNDTIVQTKGFCTDLFFQSERGRWLSAGLLFGVVVLLLGSGFTF